MTIGGSLTLIAVGAILKWAVTAHMSGFDMQTAGTVLFVVGLIGARPGARCTRSGGPSGSGASRPAVMRPPYR